MNDTEKHTIIRPISWVRTGEAGKLATKHFFRLSSGKVAWRYNTEAGLWYSADSKYDILPSDEDNTGTLRVNAGTHEAPYWVAIGTVEIDTDK